MDQGVTTQINI
jgi:3'-phosphoadenosine 5'-phosphosulfate (PAPS) 3'-phosphatase